MYQDLPELSTNVVFFQNPDISCCNGQLVELISEHKYLHHWQADYHWSPSIMTQPRNLLSGLPSTGWRSRTWYSWISTSKQRTIPVTLDHDTQPQSQTYRTERRRRLGWRMKGKFGSGGSSCLVLPDPKFCLSKICFDPQKILDQNLFGKFF